MKRNNAIKSIVSIILSVIMICSLTVPTFAAVKEEPTVEPRWTSIATMEVSMSFVGNAGNVSATARKHATASHIVGTLYLYKWNGTKYEYMDEVSGSKTIGTLGLEINFYCQEGVQYKGVLEVVAYTDGHGEREIITYYETCD